MCMSFEYMFLMMVIPGRLNLKYLIDVYLELLIEELQNLWHVGVLTWDSARDEIFVMRAVLMWTVNDLPLIEWLLDGVLLVLWGVQSVWKTHVHSICKMVERIATLTAIDNFFPESSLS
ncbi:hypothetical protein Sango_1271000 [Sesamum angolense]|uniref:Uncharacterized protein n=1 Tax=Sesamum angolense TaxID=2727404 RepID=A0AAE2BUF8_9LAMI|nr:hypothetical protein Sango_1271000 [Sesamum angolense]